MVRSTQTTSNSTASKDLMRQVVETDAFDLHLTHGFSDAGTVPIRCPFHPDEHPSGFMYANERGGGFQCVACKASCGVLDFGVAVGAGKNTAEVAEKLKSLGLRVFESLPPPGELSRICQRDPYLRAMVKKHGVLEDACENIIRRAARAYDDIAVKQHQKIKGSQERLIAYLNEPLGQRYTRTFKARVREYYREIREELTGERGVKTAEQSKSPAYCVFRELDRAWKSVKKSADGIALSLGQLQSRTGLGRRKVQKGISELIEFQILAPAEKRRSRGDRKGVEPRRYSFPRYPTLERVIAQLRALN
jgi:hypothetical protein